MKTGCVGSVRKNISKRTILVGGCCSLVAIWATAPSANMPSISPITSEQKRILWEIKNSPVRGRLVASISHEINNPLEATTNLLYLAKDLDGPPAAREYLFLADAELKRIVHITRQSLGFYRESSLISEVAIPEILDATIDLLQSKIANKTHISNTGVALISK
ncbi:histidine kinase dimerization/phospho-acceptor domain-containing protein [Acidobacterium sp. S8]|uniref:histidine kinase dimerization/phospho-acceptor domain-containing protein n=1 Tax=Acidobacterium sp. S8 TaxID=1641854 RepID=UPI00131DEBC5|nr:histidine kinase dimerization/phospho-acceptor domain-containing protein [Acidobacterium sp. S8]